VKISRRNALRGIAGFAALPIQYRSAVWAQPTASAASTHLGNPIVPGVGLCDPHVRIFNNSAYLYATHDANPSNDSFVMNDWWVWHSEDLANWELVSTLLPKQTYWGKPMSDCWATDAISASGQYFFYFSRGSEEIGVVQGNSPAGPWHDPLCAPLIAAGSTPTTARDPGIFQEQDGQTYIVFGVWNFYIAKLADSMIALAEKPRKVIIDQNCGPYGLGKTDDKPYLHKRNGIYYLSWGCYYATSNDVYGPYVYKGSVIDAAHTGSPFGDTSSQPKRNYDQLTYDRHGSFFEFRGQWYFTCNDQASPETQMYFRDSIISYVRYRNNGDIAPIVIDADGVAGYSAVSRIVPAANFHSGMHAVIAESLDGSFDVRGLGTSSLLTYPNIRDFGTAAGISLHVSCVAPRGGVIEVHSYPNPGRILATVVVQPTGGPEEYRTIRATLHHDSRTSGVELRFRTQEEGSLRLKWFQID
jgi:arabinoxylan arabinofuranohydrolase